MSSIYEYAALEKAEENNDDKKDDSSNNANGDDNQNKTVVSKSLNKELRASNKLMKLINTIKTKILELIDKVTSDISTRRKKKENAKWEEGQKKFLADLQLKKSVPGFQVPKREVKLYKYNMNLLESQIAGVGKFIIDAVQLWQNLIKKLDAINGSNMTEDDYKKLIDTYFHDNDKTNTFEKPSESDEQASLKKDEIMRDKIRGEKVSIIPKQADADWAESIVKKTPENIRLLDKIQQSLETLRKNLQSNLNANINHNGNKNINAAFQHACDVYVSLITMVISKVSMLYDLIDESYLQSTKLLDLVYTKEEEDDNNENNEEE